MKLIVVALLAAIALAGCYREKRQFEPSSAAASTPDPKRSTSLRPGASHPLEPGVTAAGRPADYEENAFAVNEGKRLFRWYNCNGCHGQGGGGMGPALMDAKWLYGSRPADIFSTITEGRPNGMPAFGGRIPADEIWQLTAYVRAMSGQLRKDVATSRADSLAGAAPENERDEEKPVAAKPAASMPVAPRPPASSPPASNPPASNPAASNPAASNLPVSNPPASNPKP